MELQLKLFKIWRKVVFKSPFFISTIMKKYLVLSTLFIVPLIFYIFLSKGIYHYQNLPILTKKVNDIATFAKDSTTFKNKFSIVCFFGNDNEKARVAMFNLNEVIYKRYYQKPYFQVVAILPEGTENNYATIIKELAAYTDISNWRFIYTNTTSINTIFNSFQTPFQLNNNYYSENVFIVDKELRLRGRKDDKDTFDGKLYGYNMNSVAVLKNKMRDDIDIIYYQFKKSAEKQTRLKLNNE